MVKCPKCNSENVTWIETLTGERSYLKKDKWFRDIVKFYMCGACGEPFTITVNSYEIKWAQT